MTVSSIRLSDEELASFDEVCQSSEWTGTRLQELRDLAAQPIELALEQVQRKIESVPVRGASYSVASLDVLSPRLFQALHLAGDNK